MIDEVRENRAVVAASIQALQGRRVFTGTPDAKVIMGDLPQLCFARITAWSSGRSWRFYKIFTVAPVPQAMQLRYLATLFDIASERSSTIVFAFPIDLTGATQRWQPWTTATCSIANSAWMWPSLSRRPCQPLP